MNEALILVGLLVEVIGQITSATSETRELLEESDLNILLTVIGEGLQSIGEALQGIGVEDPVISASSYIESAGAGASSFAAWKELMENGEEAIKLGILGDGLQGLGAALSAEAGDVPVLQLGDSLESIGATLESIGGVAELKGEEVHAQHLAVLGSWLQATGGLIQLIYLTWEAR
ncbi:hypothetical protein J2S74_004415 [Evansella vedderi]|uniref:DUF937 domain-containing protein n=1 Tax=Evansella vedderi TaxID=38282 RepID=A0ABU0A149_9BACI|nr:hypothetical protein [Evansella vedderi]MDQ0256970.1 hypothetical protein [Evansella vedderi]